MTDRDSPRVLRVVRCLLPEAHAPAWLVGMREIAEANAARTTGLIAIAVTDRMEAGGMVSGELISLWESLPALRAVIGDHWDRPVLPPGLAALTTEVSVEHRAVSGLWMGPGWQGPGGP